MAEYHGHRSWNAWNVSLWLHNDEGLYRMMERAKLEHRTKGAAARALLADLQGQSTPDGGRYNFSTIRAAMED